jgi:hypothetical protein
MTAVSLAASIAQIWSRSGCAGETLNGQTLNERWSDVWRWILDWNSWADANSCTLTGTNRRVGGAKRAIPTRITIPDITTAAAATGADWPERLDAAP